MAWTDDIDVLNNAAAMGNWTASGYDSPTLNDSSATTPIYLEGSACAWWPLKKGVTNGYVYTSTISGTPTLTGRVVVGFLNYPFADIDLIPINSLYMRLSSSTGFTTNYIQWDASAQLLLPENTPISGHTPIIGYEDSGTETGTFNGNCESVGWVATTGNSADGKQGGFDWFLVVGYLGAHSATLTNTFFSGLYSEYYDNEGNGLPGETSRPVGVLSRSGDFYQTNVRFRVGHGSSDTTNITISETSKTIFFNNLHANHELGYVFVNPGAYTSNFTLTNCVHFWNDQASGNEVFDGVDNTDSFKLDGCSFARGGDVTLPPHASTTTTYVQNCKFDDCGPIDVGDIAFEGNTVSNNTSSTGAIEMTDTSHRLADNTISDNTYGLHFASGGTYTLDGDTFSGNTYDIHFAATPAICDQNTETANGGWTAATTYYRRGMSFTGDGDVLTKATLSLRKVATPSSTLSVKVYAHSGTYGTSSVPTGSPLDTATTTINANSLTTSWADYDFIFDGGYTLSNGTYYVLTIEGSLETGGDDWQWERDTSTPSHSGNGSRYNGTWGTSSGDAIFKVYTTSGGSGSLVINATNGANPSTYYAPGGGSVTINNAVDLEVHVQDLYTGTAIQNARVRLMLVSDDSVILSGLTDASGDISDTLNYTSDVAVYGWVRKSTGSPLYQEFALSGTVTSSGYSVTAALISDE